MKNYILVISLLFFSFILGNGREFKTGCLRETELPVWVKPSPPIQLENRYLRDAIDFSADFPPILSQGGQGSCTAWSSAYYYKTYQEWQEHQWDLTLEEHRFSPAFVYNQINGGTDSGSNISDAFLVFATLGCATLADMPYNDDICTLYPEEEDFVSAMNYRTQDTYAIDIYNDLESLKNVLATGNSVVIGFTIYDSFYDIGQHDYVYAVNTFYGDNVGGHAVAACGFDDNKPTPDGNGAVKFANSWGAGWGDNGFFWISYEALQNPAITHNFAYYASDRIDYTPELITRFHVSHDNRGAVGFRFGIGDVNDPLWTQPALNWSLRGANLELPFPPSNIAIDLTDGLGFFDASDLNDFYMRAKDERYFWHRDTEHSFEGMSWWCANPEIPGYDNGWLMDMELPQIQLAADENQFSFMLSYAIEPPSDYGQFDGWDVANVSLSLDNGNSWQIIEGSLPYNVSNSWAYDYHGLGSGYAGWGGYAPDWQEVIFDLDDWAEETVTLKITFISDGAWCSRDDENFYGLAVDNLTVTGAGQELYFDDAEGSRTEGTIDYFAVEFLPEELLSEAADLPVTIHEDESYAYSNLTWWPDYLPGDLNLDLIVNVLDIVLLVDLILEYPSLPPPDLVEIADLNSDGILNVLDIVLMVGIILD